MMKNELIGPKKDVSRLLPPDMDPLTVDTEVLIHMQDLNDEIDRIHNDGRRITGKMAFVNGVCIGQYVNEYGTIIIA